MYNKYLYVSNTYEQNQIEHNFIVITAFFIFTAAARLSPFAMWHQNMIN